jgi:hypothetical protein
VIAAAVPSPARPIHSELVVAAAQILDTGVARDHHRGDPISV